MRRRGSCAGCTAVAEADGAKVRLLGSGAILREVEAAAELLREDFDVASEVWSVTSFTELRRDGLAREREARLGLPTWRRPGSRSALAAAETPVIAATDYMKALPDGIRAVGATPATTCSARTASAARTSASTCAGSSRWIATTSSSRRCARSSARARSRASVVADAIKKYEIDADRPGPGGELDMAETVKVPDIGDFDEVPVIEILVSEGDEVDRVEQALVTLESDKATMDVPSPVAGTVKEILGRRRRQGERGLAADGDRRRARTRATRASDPSDRTTRSRGTEAAEADEPAEDEVPDAARRLAPSPPPSRRWSSSAPPRCRTPQPAALDSKKAARSTPGPAFAGWRASSGSTWRSVKGSGRKGRILKEDVKAAKDSPARRPPRRRPASRASISAPWPKVNFEKYGEVERVALSRVKKISGPALARNWVMIPHVTHNDESDITDLEAFRKEVNAEQKDVKVTMVALLMKACVGALRQFPEFNSSLDGDELVIKRYYNIGFAADTPQGLLVPVIKEADRKGPPRDRARARRALGQGARGEDLGRGDARLDLHDLVARRHRRYELHADHQRARGGDPGRHALEDAAGLGQGGRGVQAAAHGPALAVATTTA